MKNTFQYLSFAFVVGVLVVLCGCGGDDPSASEVMTKKLTAHPWTLSSAMVDGNDQTTLYDGLVITFTKTGFTTTNGGVVWPASGNWEFIDKNATGIIRNDDLEVAITEATKTTLKLTFTWSKTTFEPGRVKSIDGNHVFTFTE
jgi:hypothetical protein